MRMPSEPVELTLLSWIQPSEEARTKMPADIEFLIVTPLISKFVASKT